MNNQLKLPLQNLKDLFKSVENNWPADSSLLICTKDKYLKLIIHLFIYFQRQDDYEYDESADYGEQDESEAALGLPADSSSIRENIGQAHHTCFHDSWIHESTNFFTILFFL